MLCRRYLYAVPQGEWFGHRSEGRCDELTIPQTVDRVDAAPDDPIAELYEDKAGHLTERDAVFFRKWESLVTVEEQELGRFRSQLWTMTAKQREKTGR